MRDQNLQLTRPGRIIISALLWLIIGVPVVATLWELSGWVGATILLLVVGLETVHYVMRVGAYRRVDGVLSQFRDTIDVEVPAELAVSSFDRAA